MWERGRYCTDIYGGQNLGAAELNLGCATAPARSVHFNCGQEQGLASEARHMLRWHYLQELRVVAGHQTCTPLDFLHEDTLNIAPDILLFEEERERRRTSRGMVIRKESQKPNLHKEIPK